MGSYAIIGGSGFYRVGAEEPIAVGAATSMFGAMSSEVTEMRRGNDRIFFIARHGTEHSIPPHKINYRANIDALAQLGVTEIVSINAVGALNPAYSVGQLVVPDQIVDATWGRKHTFYDDKVVHTSMSEPLCPTLRCALIAAAERAGRLVAKQSTVVVIQGPRYNTKAENRIHLNNGIDIISMTLIPECILSRERGIHYAAICMVTDNACVQGSAQHPDQPANHDQVVENFVEGKTHIERIAIGAVGQIIDKRSCTCEGSLNENY